ncbi:MULTISPECIES: DoxX family membrane protein [Elizabethkingia]|uniref:DoxX family membrane protein n=1 Tax=Elizabethkingia TaxID=308865 RepID=UPI000999A08F|nr:MULTISPECIES: DoxX family membrane protein [Elizabethkingia]AQX90597.1 DoxX family protein [Elizabethkingia anophelis]EHM7981748.1 DoxX family membrane protein [Elizabethkingia anophelis]EHM8032246.1 DoxX family membrane protein [Elizabethkingia anophelis]EHZ9535200.1 DoxX family membrane protein [Elizabethkingia anophelis]EKU3673110.1 DoxX family membrane protein [Elizabethkingia anophelis]
MNDVSYLMLRILAGISFFGHGLVRIPKLNAFSQWMTDAFSKSILPQSLVTPFSYILPIAEFLIGLLLLLGLFSEKAFAAGFVVMLVLMLGTCLIENWEALPSQMIHALILIALYQFIAANSFSLDHIIFKK